MDEFPWKMMTHFPRFAICVHKLEHVSDGSKRASGVVLPSTTCRVSSLVFAEIPGDGLGPAT